MQHHDRVVQVSLSESGQWIATGDTSGMVRLWEMPSGRPVGPPLQLERRIHSLQFTSDDAGLLISDGPDRFISFEFPGEIETAPGREQLWFRAKAFACAELNRQEYLTSLGLEEWLDLVKRVDPGMVLEPQRRRHDFDD